MQDDCSPKPVPSDYDRDPQRFRLARSVLRRHASVGDVHELVAPAVLADATALPFADATFGSVALLYVLYLDKPAMALAEARRVLRTGGLLAVAVPSGHDSPELAHALPSAALTFDAELAPAAIGELFVDVEVQRWDAALLRLPTRRAVRDYLVGKGADAGRAERAAASTEVPLSVTKRGALVFAHRR